MNSRKPTPIEQVPSEEPISEEELQRQQQLLMDYVRQAVTQENVNRFADQALEGREAISARDLAPGRPENSSRSSACTPIPNLMTGIMN